MKKIFIGFILGFLFILSACKELSQPNIEKNFKVLSVESEDELRELLSKNTYNDRYAKNDGVVFEGSPGDVASGDDATSGGESRKSHSETNVQVEGVDEGDIIKTDGDRIYIANAQTFKVVEVDGDKMKLIFEDSLSNDNYYFEMYVTDRYVVLIGSSYCYSVCDFAFKTFDQDLIISIYSLDPTIQLAKEIKINGYYNTSRLIDNKLYVMANYYVFNKVESIRPVYKIDNEEIVPEFRDIKYVPGLINNYYNIFATIVLDEEISTTFDTYLGYWGGLVYVSKDSIYCASMNYNTYKTEVVRYRINKETNHIELKGYLTVDGYILNQFSMDEYDGYFRVVTTDNNWWSAEKANASINYLYIYKIDESVKNGFKLVGSLLNGIGKPGERVMSVRFNEDEVSIVTFRQIDPLYIIDLRNPEKPRIVSELEIPGFSTYQHHWDEDTILGIGFNVVNNMTNGIKVSLFDSSDGLKEVATLLISGYGEATYNHKAILIDKEHNIFGFGVTEYDYSAYGIAYYYYRPVYYLIQVDKDGPEPLKVVGKITQDFNFDDNFSSYYYIYFYEVVRMINIEDYYYAVSFNDIKAYRFIDGKLSLVGRIKIKDFIKAEELWWYYR